MESLVEANPPDLKKILSILDIAWREKTSSDIFNSPLQIENILIAHGLDTSGITIKVDNNFVDQYKNHQDEKATNIIIYFNGQPIFNNIYRDTSSLGHSDTELAPPIHTISQDGYPENVPGGTSPIIPKFPETKP